MIKPVTYQGIGNFNSNLYALEVKSRFIDQTKAHGFYKGYGTELAASIVGNVIIIDSGAFVVCGRMNEVVGNEPLNVTIENGKVGYVVARLETYHPGDENKYCNFVVKTGASLVSIPLANDDIYAADSETTNKAYELPLYSFSMTGGGITTLTKVIQPIADYEKIKGIADAALSAATAADTKATSALSNANAASTTAGQANTKATTALSTAQDALQKAEAAVEGQGTAVYSPQGSVLGRMDLLKAKGTREDATLTQKYLSSTIDDIYTQLDKKVNIDDIGSINVKAPPASSGLVALAGNGVTDDFPNFLAMIQYAMPRLIVLYFPEGNYRFNSSLGAPIQLSNGAGLNMHSAAKIVFDTGFTAASLFTMTFGCDGIFLTFTQLLLNGSNPTQIVTSSGTTTTVSSNCSIIFRGTTCDITQFVTAPHRGSNVTYVFEDITIIGSKSSNGLINTNGTSTAVGYPTLKMNNIAFRKTGGNLVFTIYDLLSFNYSQFSLTDLSWLIIDSPSIIGAITVLSGYTALTGVFGNFTCKFGGTIAMPFGCTSNTSASNSNYIRTIENCNITAGAISISCTAPATTGTITLYAQTLYIKNCIFKLNVTTSIFNTSTFSTGLTPGFATITGGGVVMEDTQIIYDGIIGPILPKAGSISLLIRMPFSFSRLSVFLRGSVPATADALLAYSRYGVSIYGGFTFRNSSIKIINESATVLDYAVARTDSGGAKYLNLQVQFIGAFIDGVNPFYQNSTANATYDTITSNKSPIITVEGNGSGVITQNNIVYDPSLNLPF